MATFTAPTSGSLGVVLKNAGVLAFAAFAWLALDTGYFTPDRPTRAQWEKLQKAKSIAPKQLIYQSDFSKEKPGERASPIGTWGPYNAATKHTITFDQAGFTINFRNAAWLGAVFEFAAYEARTIYRVTIEREGEGEPAALLVRNRQMDLIRQQIPVGKGAFSVEFLSPRGGRDRAYIILMPDNPGKPQGRLRVSSMKIERIGSVDD